MRDGSHEFSDLSVSACAVHAAVSLVAATCFTLKTWSIRKRAVGSTTYWSRSIPKDRSESKGLQIRLDEQQWKRQKLSRTRKLSSDRECSTIYFEAQQSFLSGKKAGLIEMESILSRERIDWWRRNKAKWRGSTRAEENGRSIPMQLSPSVHHQLKLTSLHKFWKIKIKQPKINMLV